MQRLTDTWFSPHLQKEMEIAIYGDYGPALLLFPSAGADYLEYERFHMIDSVSAHINAGQIKIFSINSINNESWLNDRLSGQQKSQRHQEYNRYICEEVVPYIRNAQQAANPTIFTSGVSLGAFHSVNSFLRRPDLFAGAVGLSGVYDLKDYTHGYYDDNVYFNSPMDYLPHMYDETTLEQLRRGKVYLLSGKGNYEAPHASWEMGEVLGQKGIENWVELWGEEWTHDWPTWRAMLPSVVERFF